MADEIPDMIARDPTADDILLMAMLMRAPDVDEALALGFLSPLAAVEASVKRSSESCAVRNDEGLLIGMFGVVVLDDLPGYGMPWMTTTWEGTRRPVTVVKLAKSMLADWSSKLNLFNWVHVQNIQAKHFIEVVGFQIDEQPFMLAHTGTDELFNLFWMGEKPCVSSRPQH